MRRFGFAVMLLGFTALSAAAQDAGVRVDTTPPPPDKSGFWLFNPTPTPDLRGFAADRPAKGTSPITVDAGHFQYETDLFDYQHSNVGGVSSRLYTVADPIVKVGLTDHIDLELQFTGYNWLDEHDPTSNATVLHAQGVGDLILRTKVNVFGNEGGPALAIVPYVKFPTAAEHIGNGHTEGGVVVPFSVPLPYDFVLLLENEADVLTNALDAGHHFNYTGLVNLSHPIGKALTAEAEFFSAIGTDAHTPAVYTFDLALAWLVTPNLQLDVGSNIGLNRNASNLQLYTGLAERF